MRKPDFYICEKKDADQLCSNCADDQRLCFLYIDSTMPLLPKIGSFNSLAIVCGCTAGFVSGLVGNPEDRFSCVTAQAMKGQLTILSCDKTNLLFMGRLPYLIVVSYLDFTNKLADG